MRRPIVWKRDGRWHWECHGHCPQGGTGFRSWKAAITALLRHLAEHERLGFRA